MIGPVLRVLVVALVMLAGATVWVSNFRQNLPDPETATILPGLLALPDVSLVNAQGQPFATSDLEDRMTLMFFGFTHCPDICPITMQTLATASSDLRERGVEPPDVLFVSVDPGRDSPQRIRRYLDNFDSAFEGVTGPDDAIEPLTSTLGVVVERHAHDGAEAYNVTHNSTVFVVGHDAEVVAIFSPPHDARVIASDYLLVRHRYLSTRSESAASL